MGRIKDIAQCVECGVRRAVEHKEWIRAAQPRCFACGGRLEPSLSAHEEHVAHADAQKADQHKRDVKRAGGLS